MMLKKRLSRIIHPWDRKNLPHLGYRSIPEAKNEDMALVAVIRNEKRYLAEWIEYHHIVGFRHFYIYDNGSSDDPDDYLRQYIESGLVTLIPWSTFIGEFNIQLMSYMHATFNFGSRYKWMGYIDADEFIVPRDADKVSDVIGQFQDYGVIWIPRVNFGTSGHKSAPDGLVTENYVDRAVSSRFDAQKSIAQPNRLTAVGIHKAKTDGPSLDMAKTGGSETWPLRINHYFSKSEAEYREKLSRGWVQGGARDMRKKQNIFDDAEAEAKSDEAILRFLPELRRSLDNRK